MFFCLAKREGIQKGRNFEKEKNCWLQIQVYVFCLLSVVFVLCPGDQMSIPTVSVKVVLKAFSIASESSEGTSKKKSQIMINHL